MRVGHCPSFSPKHATDWPAEDELQNVEMAEEERRQKNTELKKARREYTGYDDDEFTGGTAGMKRAVLAKYDDDLGTSETVGAT
jgi:U4/U6.U5 tri-snRNP-associated protein 1